MYYSYVEIEYVAMSFSPARTDLALKLLIHKFFNFTHVDSNDAAYWLPPSVGVPTHVADTFCALKLPSHLIIHLALG
jgi:hypothetical protein